MNVRELAHAMTVDPWITVYLALALITVIWLLVVVGEFVWYAYRMHRAKRYSRKVIQADEFTRRMREVR